MLMNFFTSSSIANIYSRGISLALPIINDETDIVPNGQAKSGNLLTNDVAPSGRTLSIVSFTIAGSGTVHPVGTPVDLDNIGTINITSNGAWTFTPDTGFSGSVPIITYTVTDGIVTDTGTLSLNVLAAQTSVPSNPVTYALTANAGKTTYNVGPGQAMSDLNEVPWGGLQPGDVVNIFYRSTPYNWRFGTCCPATQSNPLIINGVTDSLGNRPKINLENATTAPGMAYASNGGRDIYTPGNPAAAEDYYGIAIRPATGSPYQRPSWITIQNLEWFGNFGGGNYTTLTGAVRTHGAYALRIDRADNISIVNCVGHDNGVHIFTQSNNDSMDYTCTNIKVQSCRFYDGGTTGSFLDHNLYLQAYIVTVEGCYLGALRNGIPGSTYKSRCGFEIFRYNWVTNSARALDFVHAEEQVGAMITQPNYGYDYVYGNVILNDYATDSDWGGGAYVALHYGGDNSGEDGAAGTTPYNDIPEYRKRMYFYNNTYITKHDGDANRKIAMFDLSTRYQHVWAWNNIFAVIPRSGTNGIFRMSWLEYSGKLHLLGNNLVYSPYDTIQAAREDADPTWAEVFSTGTIITGDPNFINVAQNNYGIQPGSAAIDLATGIPAGLPSDVHTTRLSTLLVEKVPGNKTNGIYGKQQAGAAFDLGALEIDATIPVNTSLPTISGTNIPGNTLTGNPGAWTNSPTFSYQWNRNGNPISGATSNTYFTVGADGGTILTLTITATNTSTGSTSQSSSAGFTMQADPSAPQNTSIPVVSGQLFVLGTATVSNGVWTNSPSGYTYQWLRGGTGGTLVGTGSSYSFTSSDEGSVFAVIVTATNASGSNSASSATTAAIGAAQPLEPGGDGYFHFTVANGITLDNVNPGWKGQASTLVVQSNMLTPISEWNPSMTWFDGGTQNDTQRIEIKFPANSNAWAGVRGMYLRVNSTTPTTGYWLEILSLNTNNVRLKPHKITGGAATALDQVDVTVNVLTTDVIIIFAVSSSNIVTTTLNGTQRTSNNDSASPPTGGYPGMVLYNQGGSVGGTASVRVDDIKITLG